MIITWFTPIGVSQCPEIKTWVWRTDPDPGSQLCRLAAGLQLDCWKKRRWGILTESQGDERHADKLSPYLPKSADSGATALCPPHRDGELENKQADSCRLHCLHVCPSADRMGKWGDECGGSSKEEEEKKVRLGKGGLGPVFLRCRGMLPDNKESWVKWLPRWTKVCSVEN